MKKSRTQIGNWRLRDHQEIQETPRLSCSNDTILESCMIDRGILDSIWEKAAQLAQLKVLSQQFMENLEEREEWLLAPVQCSLIW